MPLVGLNIRETTWYHPISSLQLFLYPFWSSAADHHHQLDNQHGLPLPLLVGKLASLHFIRSLPRQLCIPKSDVAHRGHYTSTVVVDLPSGNRLGNARPPIRRGARHQTTANMIRLNSSSSYVFYFNPQCLLGPGIGAKCNASAFHSLENNCGNENTTASCTI